MENKQTNLMVKILNPDALVLIDVIRKLPQQDIDSLKEEDILKKVEFSEDLIPLSHSGCFVKLDLVPELDDFFKSICAIASSLVSPVKEVHVIYDQDKKPILFFSYRILEILHKTENLKNIENLSNKFDDIVKNVEEKHLVHMLKEPLKIFQIDEEIFLIIGKAHRETWDLLNDLSYVYTTYRLYGSYEKGDKFSGFVCIFRHNLDKIQKLATSMILGVSDELSQLFEGNKE